MFNNTCGCMLDEGKNIIPSGFIVFIVYIPGEKRNDYAIVHLCIRFVNNAVKRSC